MSYAQKFFKSISTLGAVSALCLVMAPQSANARPGYAGRIPNGADLGKEIGQNGRDCALCHVSPNGGGTSTKFGQAARDIGGGFTWQDIYDLDSDGDGASNGEELCDPMGTYSGGAPPTCDYTDPSDDQDKPAAAMDPEPDMGSDPVDMGSDPADMGSDPADMDPAPVDMSSNPADMATGGDDMGSDPVDMAVDGADMGSGGGGADMAGSDGENDMAVSGGADMAADDSDDDGDDDDGGGCSQSGTHGAPAQGLTLLGMLGLLGFWRKRRAS